MSIIAMGGAAIQFFADSVVDAKIDATDYDGPYMWEGQDYD